MKKKKLKVKINGPGRVDAILFKILKKKYPGLSRRQLKTCFIKDLVLARNKPIKGNFYLFPTTIEIEIQKEANVLLEPKIARREKIIFIKPVFDNNDFLALNKPHSTPSLPLHTEETGTAVNMAISLYPEIINAGNNKLEGGLLHRLDNETSGVLLFAKNKESFLKLKSVWKSDVKKIYRAIVTTKNPLLFPELPFCINIDLHSRSKSAKKLHPYKPGSKQKAISARTEILKIKNLSENTYDLTIRIHTGVRHQIRAHLAAIGAPIVGDTVYGGKKSDRMWLHAWSLEFLQLKITAPLPSGWNKTK